jgi:hypothetical protein
MSYNLGGNRYLETSNNIGSRILLQEERVPRMCNAMAAVRCYPVVGPSSYGNAGLYRPLPLHLLLSMSYREIKRSFRQDVSLSTNYCEVTLSCPRVRDLDLMIPAKR